ncbi:MAG: ATP synthase subunit I [Acidimicrobiales bacterium]
MLENLPVNTLPRLLRRTVISALIMGAVAFAVAVALGWDVAALGLVFGVGLAIVNLRYLDRQAARVELKGEQTTRAVRRQLGGRTTARLALITALVLVVVFVDAPLGIGMVAGLVLYQIVFVVNVLRVVAGQGGLS